MCSCSLLSVNGILNIVMETNLFAWFCLFVLLLVVGSCIHKTSVRENSLLPSKTLSFSDWIWRFVHWNLPYFPGVHWDKFILVCFWRGYYDSTEPFGNIPMSLFLQRTVLCGAAMDFESSAVTHVLCMTPHTAAPVANASPVLKLRSEGDNRERQLCFFCDW